MPKDETQILQDAQMLEEQMKAFDEMAQGTGRFNSDADKNIAAIKNIEGYAAFRETVQKIAERSSVYFRMQIDGTYQKTDAAALADLISLYTQLHSQIGTFINNMNVQPENIKKSSTFSAFMGIAEFTKEIAGADLHTLSSLNPAKPQELPNKISENRAGKVQVNKQWASIGTTGGELSERIPISYKDKNGTEHKGFFTEDHIIDYSAELKTTVTDCFNYMSEDMNVKKEQPALYKVMKHFFENVSAVPELANDPEALYNEVFKPGVLEEHLKNNFSYFKKKYGGQYSWGWSQDDEAEIQAFLNKPKGTNYENLKEFCSGYTDVMFNNLDHQRKAFKQYCYKNPDDPSQGRFFVINRINGTSIVERNCAMSAVANLLGVGSKIAYSEKVIAKDAFNVERKGIFMENAVGEDLSRSDDKSTLAKTAMKYWKNPKMAFSGQAKKDLYSIQMLDYICNNVDRHQSNMLYKVDEGTFQITGIQGIDNDQSFGTEVPDPEKESPGNDVALNHLLFVPKDMAEKIKALEPELLEMALKGFNLSEAERKAAGVRLKQVQEALKLNRIREMDDQDFENLNMEEEAKKPAEAGKNSQTSFLKNMPRVIAAVINNNLSKLKSGDAKKLNKVNAVKYNEAEYKEPETVDNMGEDACEHQAARISAEIRDFRKKLKDMRETDLNVKFAHSQFGELETALEKAVKAGEKAAYAMKYSTLRTVSLYDRDYKEALKQIQTKAIAYIDTKKDKNIDTMKPWPKKRLTLAQNLLKLGRDREALIAQNEQKDKALRGDQYFTSTSDELMAAITKAKEILRRDVLDKNRPIKKIGEKKIDWSVITPEVRQSFAVYIVCSELQDKCSKDANFSYDSKKLRQDISHMADDKNAESVLKEIFGEHDAAVEDMLNGYEMCRKLAGVRDKCTQKLDKDEAVTLGLAIQGKINKINEPGHAVRIQKKYLNDCMLRLGQNNADAKKELDGMKKKAADVSDEVIQNIMI